ncbi:hypothetical protein [Gimesia aquarii]|uniref:Uncharacterized protein n=1 Tax=Gimesia aquarii TaxID=2527964 RepID=A0A517VP99_9PLAN|nr:hypothetical protein [Gimesia aquarii]QDT94832.1 hypothetical protein V144x_02640 [Gimesia aquarii]
MSTKYSSEIDATPEYVLSVLQDEHRQIVQVDDACDPDIDLTFDSTVADWRDAMDYLHAKQLGRGLNVSWALSLPDAAWRNVLTPEREKTLRDVTLRARNFSLYRSQARHVFRALHSLQSKIVLLRTTLMSALLPLRRPLTNIPAIIGKPLYFESLVCRLVHFL